ncbi:DHS-like NAD/FAD-binding domain-containing protein [Mycena rebaudengoi]|nr:DHS-like NAD/FAD-binding domain-containing protein [Mycena rebaudengoi]
MRSDPAVGFHQVPRESPLSIDLLEVLDHSFVGLSGGEIFHESTLRHDVKHIFGYPEGAILPASPGVVLVTSGPGATNVVTPMQDALSDGIPLVVFSGQVATSSIGSDAFQEAAELPRRINEAFKIATSGRPGPVLVDLPKDVTTSTLRVALPFRQTTPGHAALVLSTNPLALPEPPIDNALILQAAALINQAQRPIVYAGAGVLSPPQGPVLLAQLAELGNIPVCMILQGLGAFDETHPKSLHILGMHGSAYANLAMQQANVILALGARFDDRVTGEVDAFVPEARAAAAQGCGGIIHFEILPENINKVVEATIPDMAALVQDIRAAPREAWFADINLWKEKYPFSYTPSEVGARIKPQEVMEELDAQCKMRKGNMIVSTGVGQHQILSAAIGAKVAAPHKIVVDIDGDASFSMTAMELATASQYNISVKVLVLNNEFQGMVLQWQDLFYEARYSHTRMTNPDLMLLARAMGVYAIRCETAADLPAKMAEFLAYDNSKPVLMECLVERN